MPSRRRVLQLGLLGGAALAVSGVGLSLQPGGRYATPATLQVLTPRQFAALSAAAEAILPDPVGRPSATDARVAELLDALFATLTAGVQAEMRQLLTLLDNPVAGGLIAGRWRPFSTLSVDERRAVLRRWRGSRVALLRSGCKALTGFVSGTYWTTPGGLLALDYPGPQPHILAARKASLLRDAGGITP